MAKTSTELEENVAGLLCYIFGWVSGLVLLLVETESKFVRFHAMQSFIVFGFFTIVVVVFRWIPFIGFAWPVILLFGFVLWIVLMIKAYQGILYKLPVAGNLAGQWLEKLKR